MCAPPLSKLWRIVARIQGLETIVAAEAEKLANFGRIADQVSKATAALAELADSAQALKDTLQEE